MRILILGAGMAGLSTGHFLKKNGFHDFTIHEASDHIGGIAASFEWHGFTCDHAPHRLFTSNTRLLQEMRELVPMEKIRRQSSIFIRGKWIQDPVNAAEVMLKFFPHESAKIAWGYLFRSHLPENNFDAMVLNRFGKGLNEFFFRPYSEKLFGIPPEQISTAWGRNKIRVGGLIDMVRRNTKLYYNDFYYPTSGGFGAIPSQLARGLGPHLRLVSRFLDVRAAPSPEGYLCRFEEGGRVFEEKADVIISSLPIPEFFPHFGINPNLRYRSAKLAYLLINRPRVTKNHWFYLADSDFLLNRVVEFKNFTQDVADPGRTVLCGEVTRTERFSMEAVIHELTRLGLVRPEEVIDTLVVDLKHAYPIYDLSHDKELGFMKEFSAQHPNVHAIGRNAVFAHKDVDEIFHDSKSLVEKLLNPPTT